MVDMVQFLSWLWVIAYGKIRAKKKKSKSTVKNYQSSKQVKDEMKSIIANYSESMDVYSIINGKLNIAIQNAKKVEKYQIENKKNINSEDANPHTSVYKVIEELIKRNEI